MSSNPESADEPSGSQEFGVGITLAFEPGDDAVVQMFGVPQGKPGYEGAPVWDSNEARRGGALAQLQQPRLLYKARASGQSRNERVIQDGGGGAYFLDILVVLTAFDTSFQNNSASSMGGAVDTLPKSAVAMSRVNATGSKASGSRGFAGLVCVLVRTTFCRCVLSRDEACGGGAETGAVLIADAPSDIVVSLRKGTVEKNHVDGKVHPADGGLAIRTNVDLEDVHFSANEACNGDGSALALLDTSESTVSSISNADCAEVTIQIVFRFTTATCLPLEFSENAATCVSIAIGCAAYKCLAHSVDSLEAFSALFRVGCDQVSERGAEDFIAQLNRTATASAGCGC